MVQLVHAGRYAGPWEVYHEARRLAPSAARFELTAGRVVAPHEITPGEIAEAIGEFGRAAQLCERAGFDGVDVPVVANGRLGDPVDAAGVLERGDAGAIGLARPLFVDPDWPRKVADGDLAAVRTCPCDPPNCLRTQLSGAICDHWPPSAVARGYLGVQD